MLLNESQLQFIKDISKFQRVLAPAGSGKTHVILEKANQILLEQANSQILILTFTNTNVEELQARTEEYPNLKNKQDKLDIKTLNSFGFQILQNNKDNPKLLSGDKEKRSFVKDIFKSFESENKNSSLENKEDNNFRKNLLKLIDSFKSLMFVHEADDEEKNFFEHYEKLVNEGFGRQLEQITFYGEKIFKKLKNSKFSDKDKFRYLYEEFFTFYKCACKRSDETSKFTFEDQKYFAYLMLKEKGKNIKNLKNYTHIFVDEFQDINLLDLELTKILTQVLDANLYIIGDDDQAIYEWRGSSPKIIVEPEKYFGQEFKTHIFEINYRVPKNLLEHSQNLISYNQTRVPKKISAQNQNLADIQIHKTASTYETMKYVLDFVKNLDKTKTYKLAILSRKRAPLIPYQIYFVKHKIHFYCPKDLQVLLSKTFDELLNVLTVRNVFNDLSELSYFEIRENILTLTNKIFSKPMPKESRQELGSFILKYLNENDLKNLNDLIQLLNEYHKEKKNYFSERILKSLGYFFEAKTVSETLDVIYEHFEGFSSNKEKAEEDIFYADDSPLPYLSDYATEYKQNFEKFIRDLEDTKEKLGNFSQSLIEEDEFEYKLNNQQKTKIYLLTALRAKGREFDEVMILDAVDGNWPAQIDYIEEERRLFYVAITRSKQKLTITLPTKRRQSILTPSPFLNEAGFDV